MLLLSPGFSSIDCDPTRKLYLLTIFPYPSASQSEQPSWNQGTNILPAAYLAADLINERYDVLHGYELELINSCDIENVARLSFIKNIIADRGQAPVVGIIGPGCSASTLAVSPHSSHPHIALLNLHLAGTPLVENRTEFSYSLGFLGSSYGFVNATVALMHRGGWKRIAILYDEERTFFLSTYQALERDLLSFVPNAKIAFTSAVYDTYFPIANIVALDIRIIIILTGEQFARKLLCLASHGQVTYPKYQWVWMGRSVAEFNETVSFHYFSNEYNCSDIMLQTALSGNLFVNYKLKRNDNNVTKANLTYDQYWELYNQRIDLYNNGQAGYTAPGDPLAIAETNRYATFVFDAVWAIALALNKVEALVNLTSYGLGLGQTKETSMIRNVLYSHSFEGVSGHISISDSNGYTDRMMEVHQVQGSNSTLIGYVHGQTLEEQNTPGLIPSEFQNEGLQVVNASVAVVFALFTIAIVSLTMVVHALTILYRKHPSIKAQSPKLNQISFAGFYLFSAGTLLIIVYKAIPLEPNTYANICQAIWAWCFSISFSIFFAPICMRTWRLYRIFTHYLNPGPLISDPVLLTGVGVLVGVDVLVAIIWTSVDSFQEEEFKGDIKENGDFTLRLSCSCQYTIVWYSMVYLLKMILLLGTVILSLLTRNITNQKYKTTFLRVFVYLFALTWFLGLILYCSLSYRGLNIHIDYAVLAITCNLLLAHSLFFVFLPPISHVLREELYPAIQTIKIPHQEILSLTLLHTPLPSFNFCVYIYICVAIAQSKCARDYR